MCHKKSKTLLDDINRRAARLKVVTELDRVNEFLSLKESFQHSDISLYTQEELHYYNYLYGVNVSFTEYKERKSVKGEMNYFLNIEPSIKKKSKKNNKKGNK